MALWVESFSYLNQ